MVTLTSGSSPSRTSRARAVRRRPGDRADEVCVGAGPQFGKQRRDIGEQAQVGIGIATAQVVTYVGQSILGWRPFHGCRMQTLCHGSDCTKNLFRQRDGCL